MEYKDVKETLTAANIYTFHVKTGHEIIQN